MARATFGSRAASGPVWARARGLEFDGVKDGKEALSAEAVSNINKTPIAAIRASNESTPVTNSTTYVVSGCETQVLLPGMATW